MRPVRVGLGLLVLCMLAFGCGGGSGQITELGFLAVDNPGLTEDVYGTIDGTTIEVTVPGAGVTNLVATFEGTCVAVFVDNVRQVSGATANDFTSPVIYDCEDADGIRLYSVHVTREQRADKELTAFAFTDAANSGLAADVTATIDGTAIAATVPFGTDVGALVATFTVTGERVTVGGVDQVSGTTPHTFAAPVTYTVHAQDGTTRDYTVTVTISPSTAKDLVTFAFLDAPNVALDDDVVATINGTAIAVTVPFGTAVGALIASFTTTGASVAVGATPQVSGTTPNHFGSPVGYVVTAADGSTKTYTVTVTVAANPAKDLTAFAFLDSLNAALSADVTAVIAGTAITATVPFGTDTSALIATFSTTGASVAVGATPQVSGITANDFTGPVTYVVTAADGSTQSYTVTLAIAPDDSKDITAFQIGGAVGTIAGTTISVEVPAGTDVTALVATFTHTGAGVAIGGAPQESGVTPNDFTSPQSYVVTAADASTKTYVVTVTVAPA